jgi:hypothetical protein
MCKFGEIEEVVVCDNNNDRKFSLISYQSCFVCLEYKC